MARPALLDEVLEAAGGERRWRAASRISARVETGGLLPRTRIGGTGFRDYRLSVWLERPRAVMTPFPAPGRRAVFDAGSVTIEAGDGTVQRRRQAPREAFFGLSGLRRNLRWDPLDAAYFTGYAMWNYLAFPLLLTMDGIEVSAGRSWSGEGSEWRSLDARFPAALDTHSAEQTFWFDADARLVRHDYTAAVIGGWARAAHYCSEHRPADGLLVPTVRRVLPRRANLRSRPFPTLVSLRLSELTAE